MTMMLSSVEYEVASPLFFCPSGPVMMSLKPGSQVAESYSEMNKAMGGHRGQSRSSMGQLGYIQDQLRNKDGAEDGNHVADDASQTAVFNGDGFSLCSPPRTENEVRDRSGSSGWTIPLLLGLNVSFFSPSACSCSWSSTSSRRRSDGWGSCSTRGTCTSGSWSWRLRTWKTLTTHFKTRATRRCPVLTHHSRSWLFHSSLLHWAQSHCTRVIFVFPLQVSLHFPSFHSVHSTVHILFLYIHLNTLPTYLHLFALSFLRCTAMQVHHTFFAFFKTHSLISEKEKHLPWLNVAVCRRKHPVWL